MKKVLFVDEKYYRFSFYYEPNEWWHKNGIKPYLKAYEKKRDKWFIYLWLIFNRPYTVVLVQLSLKNIILAKLCNLIGVKTLFWQHGVFKYDDKIIKKYRKINSSLTNLFSLSDYDRKQISRYFKEVQNSQLMSHYESSKIANAQLINNSVLYIGQILTKEQIKDSSAKFPYDKQCEIILNNLWKYFSKQDYKVFLKKHPGDKSNYLEHLCEKYPNFSIIKQHIIPSAIIGHYSTLVLPYLQMGIPFIQIHHELNDYINFQAYSSNEIVKISNPNMVENLFQFKKIVQDDFDDHKSISYSILKVLNT